MFCKFCGAWLRTTYKFCPRCGKSPDSPKESTGSQPVTLSSFNMYAAKKSQERQAYRKPGKKSKKEEMVTINIGIASVTNGVFKAMRGKALPLKVAKTATYDEVLKAALEKRTAYDRSFRWVRSKLILCLSGFVTRLYSLYTVYVGKKLNLLIKHGLSLFSVLKTTCYYQMPGMAGSLWLTKKHT